MVEAVLKFVAVPDPAQSGHWFKTSTSAKCVRSSHLRHMKPGLRGRYPVQSAKSRVDINSIGKVMRMPCSTAVLRAASLAPGRKADTCGEPISTARASAVLNAEPSMSGRATASGPMWPPVLQLPDIDVSVNVHLAQKQTLLGSQFLTQPETFGSFHVCVLRSTRRCGSSA